MPSAITVVNIWYIQDALLHRTSALIYRPIAGKANARIILLTVQSYRQYIAHLMSHSFYMFLKRLDLMESFNVVLNRLSSNYSNSNYVQLLTLVFV